MERAKLPRNSIRTACIAGGPWDMVRNLAIKLRKKGIFCPRKWHLDWDKKTSFKKLPHTDIIIVLIDMIGHDDVINLKKAIKETYEAGSRPTIIYTSRKWTQLWPLLVERSLL